MTDALYELCVRRDQRESFGIAARAKALRQTWSPIFDALEDRYLHLVSQSGHVRERRLPRIKLQSARAFSV
jgi:hypothetical protein